MFRPVNKPQAVPSLLKNWRGFETRSYLAQTGQKPLSSISCV